MLPEAAEVSGELRVASVPLEASALDWVAADREPMEASTAEWDPLAPSNSMI